MSVRTCCLLALVCLNRIAVGADSDADLDAGRAAMAKKDFAAALVSFHQAETESTDPRDKLAAKDGQAAAQRALRHFSDAIEAETSALALASALEKADLLSDRHRQLGDDDSDAGKLPEALAAYQKALALVPADRLRQARLELRTGHVLDKLNRPTEAVNALKSASRLFAAAGDVRRSYRSRMDVANVYLTGDDPSRAAPIYREVERAAAAANDTGTVADALYNLGFYYGNAGDPQRSLAAFSQSLDFYRRSGDAEAEYDTLQNIGAVYGAIGQFDKAKDFYTRMIAAAHNAGDRRAEGQGLNAYGYLLVVLQHPREGLVQLQRAIAMQTDVRDETGVGETLCNVGEAYLALGDSSQAISTYQDSLARLRKTSRGTVIGVTLEGLSRAYLMAGRASEAMDAASEANALFTKADDIHRLARSETALGRSYEMLHKRDGAESAYRRAMAATEAVRKVVGSNIEAGISVLHNQSAAYVRLTSLLVIEGRASDAFEVAERAKARGLLDAMAGGRIDFNRFLSKQERARESALVARCSVLSNEMVSEAALNVTGSRKRYMAAQANLRLAERELSEYRDALYARKPALAHRRAAVSASAAAVVRALPGDTDLLDFAILQDGLTSDPDRIDRIAVFRVGKGVDARFVNASASLVVQEAHALRSACANPRLPWKARSAHLARLLIGGTVKRRVVVCPDGALWDLPFAVLLVRREPLVVRHELAYAYSASAAIAAMRAGDAQRGKTGPGTLVLFANPSFGGDKRFGDDPSVPGQRPIDTPSRPIDTPSRPIEKPTRPIDTPSRPIDVPSRPIDTPSRDLMIPRGAHLVDLPGTRREAEALLRIVPGARLHMGQEALATTAMAQMGRYRYVHFATHGFFNDASPMLSCVVLADPKPGSGDDGFLTARKIVDLDLSHVELTILSACNTARGSEVRGEGVIGLTWALFAAGCPSQVVSQWSVDDASTAQLMATFYRGLILLKQSKSSALRTAALTLRRNRRYQHPYYWAPFVLLGDWR